MTPKTLKKNTISSKDELSVKLQIISRNKCSIVIAFNAQIILKIIGSVCTIDNLLSIYYVPRTRLSGLKRSFYLILIIDTQVN